MPRYYFHTEDGCRFPDEEGTELPDVEAARTAAAKVFGELLRDAPRELWNTGTLRLIVEDEARRQIFVLAMTATDYLS